MQIDSLGMHMLIKALWLHLTAGVGKFGKTRKINYILKVSNSQHPTFELHGLYLMFAHFVLDVKSDYVLSLFVADCLVLACIV